MSVLDNNYSTTCSEVDVMKFQVTEITFDFEDDNFELPPSMQSEVIDETLSKIWETDDEDDLIDDITTASGWCIKSIDYEQVLN